MTIIGASKMSRTVRDSCNASAFDTGTLCSIHIHLKHAGVQEDLRHGSLESRVLAEAKGQS